MRPVGTSSTGGKAEQVGRTIEGTYGAIRPGRHGPFVGARLRDAEGDAGEGDDAIPALEAANLGKRIRWIFRSAIHRPFALFG